MSKALSDLRAPGMDKVDWFLQSAGIGTGDGGGSGGGGGQGTGEGTGEVTEARAVGW